uniref:Thioesterase domain-containing protein n=1 Tax=Setaria viridis TaxID=4556 RepID=A0A4V6D4E6_SETVI|nr:hypothetical protein SEVIR_7G203850v2 [Setaria viridis]
MQQQMAGLVRQVTGLSLRPRPADVSSGIHGQHRVVARTGRARTGRVVVAVAHVAARPKYCRLRGAAAIAVPETSRQLLDQQEVRPSNDTASNPLITTIRKDKFFEIEMKVRDDELDEYGVVNNAIYASYLHSGRDVVLEQLGISVDYWTSTGNAMALSELNLKYFAPLRVHACLQSFVVKVKPVQIKGVRMIVEHMIETLPDRKLVLEGRATVVCLNKDFRPTRVFPELSARAMEVFSCKVA